MSRLHVLIIKFIRKFQKNENEGKLKIMRDDIVDNNVVHTITKRIMNSLQQF